MYCADVAVDWREGRICFDLSVAAPDLLAMLPDDVRALVGQMRDERRFPVARTALPFVGASFFRPRSHARAFYQTVEPGVLAYKGGEVWSHDFACAVATLSEGRTCLNRNDFFLMLEQKAPLAYLTSEARADARKGLALYRAVYAMFSERPDLPLPLLVVEWPDGALARYREVVYPSLSQTARDIAERLLRDGLAMYVYHFPQSPARVRHRDGRALGTLVEHRQLVARWIALFTRILCAGYLPCVLSNQLHGACIQDQNVCVSGGFVDVDSVEAMSQSDDTMFALNLLASVQVLAHTIYVSLGPWARPLSEQLLHVTNCFGSGLHGTLVLPQVWALVRAEFRRQRERGIVVDPRLEAILLPDDPMAALAELLRPWMSTTGAGEVEQTAHPSLFLG